MGPTIRRGEAQAYHLTSAIANESALVRLPSRYVHRYPLRRAHQLDLDILRELSPLNFAAYLFSHRLALALFPAAKVMAR